MTADDLYAQNLAFLHAHPAHAQTYAEIGARPLTNIKLIPAPTGALYGEVYDIVTQQWVALCHPQDPWGQAEASVDQFYTPNARVFCMIGLGLGYNAVAFARRLKPYQRLCIWDVDGQLFKAMLSAVDIQPLFSTPNVNLLVGDECLNVVEQWWLSLHAPEKLMIQMPMQEGYTTVYLAPAYRALMEKTIEMLRFHGVGLSTWRQFGRAIGDNDLLNLPEYFVNPGYEHLEGLWQGKPAVCLAAGPSLQRNLAQLLPPAVRERMVIISAGTVYALAQGMGLAPEITTTIDFQLLNWTDQYRRIPLDPQCALVYLHSTHPQTPRRWPGPTFVAENSSDTVHWLRRYSEGKKSAAEVQTVAHLSLKVALTLGANPIILLGQDLSMPKATHHAPGARAQDMAPSEAPTDAFIEVPDFEGKPVHTRHSFLSMLTVFERLIREAPQQTVYNCSEAGLRIPGAEHCPLATVLASVVREPVPTPLRPALHAAYHRYVPQVQPTLYSDLASLRQQVRDLGTMAAAMEATEVARLQVQLTDDQHQAAASSDALCEAETLDQVRSEHDAHLATYEAKILAERPMAWAMVAIRRFDFIELMAEVPPPLDAVATIAGQRRYNAARLLRIAAMMREEVPAISELLRQAERRLHVLLPPPENGGGAGRDLVTPESQVMRLIAQQAYPQAVRLLQEHSKTIATETCVRLLAQLYLHRQEYQAAQTLLWTWQMAPQHARRSARHLVQARYDTAAALPAYFPHPAATPALLAPQPTFY